ncbi:MAG: Uma2 family endonuclease [Pirellulales bacterium]|nr:Uma2 family endonuclease [Pirellulales bacterium]
MIAAKQIERNFVDDYLADKDVAKVKHDSFGGFVYAMADARTAHNRVAAALNGWLYSNLRGRRCEPYNSDAKVRVRLPTQTRYYYPDGMVVCEPNPPESSYQDNPVVIAEVISEGIRRIDEGEQRDVYLTSPTLAAYLSIETDWPRVVIDFRSENGFAAEAYEEMDAVIAHEVVQIDRPLAEIDERVEFAST